MPWSGGSYTKGNNATGGWTGDASLGIGIEAGRHDTQDNDFATGINQCLNKDGSNAATGNLNLGGFKLANVATGTASTDAINLLQAQSGINTQSTTLEVTNTRFSNDTVGPSISLQKSRGATVGTNTIVTSGDSVGALFFRGANGTGYSNAAIINCEVDGTPGATNDMPGRLVFATTPDGSSTATERMRINSAGGVGFGTTTAGIAGTIGVPSGGAMFSAGNVMYSRANAYYNGTNVVYATSSGATQYSQDASAQSHVWSTAASGTAGNTVTFTDRMKIVSTGEVLVETPTSNGTAYKLQVGNSTGQKIVGIFGGSSAASDGSAVSFWNGAGQSGSIGNYSALQGGAYDGRFTIKNSGASLVLLGVTAAVGTHFLKWNNVTGAWTYDTSSARYKQDIVDSPYGLNEVLAMRPVTFTYKAEPDRHDVGFIAEEMVQVVPEVVAKNTDGEPDAISYDRLTSVLCKAIQELEARVAALEGA